MSDAGYDLVMPFVVCESQGGPYDDAAFVAGWECGKFDTMLSDKPEAVVTVVRLASMPQYDLIGMRYGYVVSHEPYDDEWTAITFTLAQKSGIV